MDLYVPDQVESGVEVQDNLLALLFLLVLFPNGTIILKFHNLPKGKLSI